MVGTPDWFVATLPGCCGLVESILENPKAAIAVLIGEHELHPVRARIQKMQFVQVDTSTHELRRTAFHRHAIDPNGIFAGEKQPAAVAAPTRALTGVRH